jgi:uncharacterized protein (DUF2062 family)
MIGQLTSRARRVAAPTSYTGPNRIPAVLLLWLVLVGIAVAKNNGRLPDQRHTIALGVATLGVAAAASMAPRVVFYLLLAGVLAVAFSNTDVVANYISRGTAAVRDGLAGA